MLEAFIGILYGSGSTWGSVHPLGVHECILQTAFPLRKFYTPQIFLLARMHLRNHVDTQLVKHFKRLTLLRAIWNVASAQECDFTAQLVWWHCAFAQLLRKREHFLRGS